MRVALVHELLTIKGGAERVAKIFSEMFPKAPIYTLLYNQSEMGDWFDPARVRTSHLQHRFSWLPKRLRFNHHLYLRQFPAAVEAWDFSQFDIVLSSSSAFAHGLITNNAPPHVSYIHSPARYLWDRAHDVLQNQKQPIVGCLRKKYLATVAHQLRQWDAQAATRTSHYLAASQTVQRRIQLYWRQPSTVVTPPIDDFWFSPHQYTKGVSHYPPRFLLVSTLAPYKRIDLAIHACNQLRYPLSIAGTGPALNELKRLAGPTISFLGRVEGEALKKLYCNATATIFPGDEDFGLVPLESLACGTPVVAFGKGGATETLRPNTALFFDESTVNSLVAALQKISTHQFNASDFIAAANQHRQQNFEANIIQAIDTALSNR